MYWKQKKHSNSILSKIILHITCVASRDFVICSCQPYSVYLLTFLLRSVTKQITDKQDQSLMTFFNICKSVINHPPTQWVQFDMPEPQLCWRRNIVPRWQYIASTSSLFLKLNVNSDPDYYISQVHFFLKTLRSTVIYSFTKLYLYHSDR